MYTYIFNDQCHNTHILFNNIALQGIFKCRVREQENYVSCVLFYPQKYTVSYIRTTGNLAGPPDFHGWWSDGPLSIKCTSLSESYWLAGEVGAAAAVVPPPRHLATRRSRTSERLQGRAPEVHTRARADERRLRARQAVSSCTKY